MFSSNFDISLTIKLPHTRRSTLIVKLNSDSKLDENDGSRTGSEIIRSLAVTRLVVFNVRRVDPTGVL